MKTITALLLLLILAEMTGFKATLGFIAMGFIILLVCIGFCCWVKLALNRTQIQAPSIAYKTPFDSNDRDWIDQRVESLFTN